MMHYQRLIFSLVLLFSIIGIFYYIADYNNVQERTVKETISLSPVLSVGDKIVQLEIADTDEKRELGLSYRESLCATCGMLFVFDALGSYGFWMKDMRFDLDIVYIDNDKRVIAIFPNVSRNSYVAENPRESLFVGREYQARYVLEINAGYARELGLQVGDVLQW